MTMEKDYQDRKKCLIRKYTRNIKKNNIVLKDLTLCLANNDCFQAILDRFEYVAQFFDFSHFIGVDARGFIFASALTDRLHKGFVYARKQGKLPGNTVSITYNTEYSTDSIEIDKDSIKPGSKLILVDDVYATGGTAKAITDLVEQLGAEIIYYMFIWDLQYVPKSFVIPTKKLHSIFKEVE